MRIATITSAVITLLLLLTAMTCGLWIRSNAITDPGSLDFHVAAGIAAVVACAFTLVLVIVQSTHLHRKA